MFLVKCINNKGKERHLKIDRVYSVFVVIERNNSLMYGLKEIPCLLFESERFIIITPPGNALFPMNDNNDEILKAA